jgi:protein ImuA
LCEKPVKQAGLEALRWKIAQLERGSTPVASDRFSLGLSSLDEALSGGLLRGGLHEIFAATTRDEPSASGFAIMLALRASGKRPIVWVRQDFASIEAGEIYAPGLNELGLSPDRVILVRARDGPAVLRAGEEAARCGPLGAVLIEPWGAPKALDLAASRRLALAAAQSGVSLFLVRAGASPSPSAATTRWQVASAPSIELEANAPGHPAFALTLLRCRAGISGRSWIVEWDRDNRTFKDIAPQRLEEMAGGMVPLPAGGPDHASGEEVRRTG